MFELIAEAFARNLLTALLISLIPLSASMSVGLLLAFVQAVTQIQEQSFTFTLKLLAAAVALYLSRAFWLSELRDTLEQGLRASAL